MKKRRVVVDDRMQRGYEYFRTGVFGGKYMTDCRKEFPARWFSRAKLCAQKHDASLNCFGVNASQPLSVWRDKGWLHPDDPRGWFQWYGRYWMGRRRQRQALLHWAYDSRKF